MTATSFRVYHNNAVDESGAVSTEDVTTSGTTGREGTFMAAKVWLVSAYDYTSEWQNAPERPDPVNTESFDAKQYGGEERTNFELLTIDPNIDPETSALTISTPYRTSSAYWTKTVYFGYKADEVKFTAEGAFDSEESMMLTEADLYDQIIPKADAGSVHQGPVR